MVRAGWVVMALATFTVASRSQSAVGGLDGVVFDSLRMAPLAGALVAPDGAPFPVRTDSAGRFAFDSLPAGRYAIVVESESLDSLGVAVSTITAEVAAGARRHVVLTVPSSATLLALACPGIGLGVDGGALLGVVRDAAGGATVTGARVGISWTEWTLMGGKLVSQPAQGTAVSGANGVYRFCGVPSGAQIHAHAIFGARESGELEVRIADFGLARRDLTVGAAGEGTVRGTVADRSGAPLAGARLDILGDSAFAMSDERGAFQLAGVLSGTRILEARRVGFAPFALEVELRAGAPAKVQVVLVPPPPVLSAVVVRAPPGSTGADAEGYKSRKQRLSGQFVDREKVASYGSVAAVEMLRGIRGMDVHFTEIGATAQWLQSGAGNFFTRSTCVPTYFLDGVEVDEQLLPKSKDIENFEVYGPGMAPPRYGGARSSCAVVLFWSRRLEVKMPAPKAAPPDSAGTSH